MSSNRNIVFADGEIYHILNMSIAKEEIFLTKNHLNRILNLFEFYRFPQDVKYSEFGKLSVKAKQYYIDSHKNKKPLIDIYGFSIMPNHWHILSKQMSENGIVKFASNIQNAYAKYFNKIADRDGSLFKRPFRAKHIDSDEMFLHILRYIHLNPVTSYIVEFKDLASFPWNSYSRYLKSEGNNFVNTDLAIRMLGSIEKFIKFTSDQENYQKKLAYIKSACLE